MLDMTGDMYTKLLTIGIVAALSVLVGVGTVATSMPQAHAISPVLGSGVVLFASPNVATHNPILAGTNIGGHSIGGPNGTP